MIHRPTPASPAAPPARGRRRDRRAGRAAAVVLALCAGAPAIHAGANDPPKPADTPVAWSQIGRDARYVFARPRHPYTQGLIRSIPRVDKAGAKTRLEAIPGTVPSLANLPPGCRFAPRCRFAMPICTQATPPLREVAPGHKVACVL